MQKQICRTPEETFALGEKLGSELAAGDVVLIYGGLGAGKTLLTKGILHALGYDAAEVTSPSFALVNLYKTDRFDVYHIDLWRLDGDADEAVGLDEILDRKNAVTVIEWAERLDTDVFAGRAISIRIDGDGDQPRAITKSSWRDKGS